MGLDSTTQITMTVGGTTFHVWDEGTEEEFSRDGSTTKAVRRIRCAWTDRLSLAGLLIGSTTNIAGTTTYVQGAPYPDQNQLVVNKVKIRGDGLMSVGTNGMVAYQRAELLVTYQPYWYDQNGIGAEEITFGSVAVATSQTQSTFKWASGNSLPPSQAPAIRYSTMEFTESRQVAVLPKALIASLQDHRNSVPIFGMSANNVLFQGGRSQRTLTVLGAQNWTVSYNFSHIPIGWHRLWNASTNAYEAFTFKDGSELFPPGDLNQLFA